MKKILAIAFGLVAFSAQAANEPNKTAVETQSKVEPKLSFVIFDVSGKVENPLKTNQLSLSKKHQLCWMAFDLPLNRTNQVTEVFLAPTTEAKFSTSRGNVTVSEDKKSHTVMTMMESNNGEYIRSCWAFDNSDPLGKYSMEIRVNNIQYPAQYFEIVK